MPAGTRHFTPALFAFLRDLAAHNNRDWFLANRAQFDKVARDPALRFIADVAPHLRKLSRHLLADARPVGGSLFRINRDIRFSSDKSPYKTNIGMSFGLDAGKGVAAPGLYLHIAPGESFAGGGVHMPEPVTLTRIRDSIVAGTPAWRRITTSATFAPMFVNMGVSLKRPPQGYDPEHPFVDDLRRKSYTWHQRFSEKDVCAADFLDRYVEACRTAAPLMRFLASSLGVAW